MNAIVERYRRGEIPLQEATDYCYLQRNRCLHQATSYRNRGEPQETAKVRAKLYREASYWYQQFIECLKISWVQTTPEPQVELDNGQILHSVIGNTYYYVPPADFNKRKILHSPQTAEEKLARENTAFLRIEAIIEELKKYGY